MQCPKCSSDRAIRSGLTVAGSQRYQCLDCKKRWTPDRKSKKRYDSRAEQQRAYRERKRKGLKNGN